MELEIKDHRLPLVTSFLVAVNVLVFLLLEWKGSTENTAFMYHYGALYGPAVLRAGEYYRLLTAVFMHFGATHLMHNMLMLFLVGQRLEKAVGSLKFLLIYLVSGLGANIFTLWFYEIIHLNALSAGASGAIMGIIGGLFACVLKNRNSVGGIDRRQILMLAAFSLYSGFVSSSTNNAAHISGMIFGFLTGLLLYRAET